MTSTRLRSVALLGAALVAAAGCGGARDSGAGAGADVAPASTAVFVSVANDPESEQWQTAERLLARFPGGRDALAELHEALSDEGLDFERDVRPALGPEVDLVVLDLAGAAESPPTVLLTQPPDEERLRALVEESDEAAYRMVDDWAVIAESDAVIDEFEEARGDESLAETDAWEEATDELPDDALVRGFLNGEALTRAAAVEGAGAGTSFLPGRGIPSTGFALRAEEDGLHVDAASRTEGEEAPESYEAELPEDLPAGALAYVSWSDAAAGIRDSLRQAGDENAEIDRYVAQGELALGVSLEQDVLPLLEGEGALAAYPGDGAAGMPALVLVLSVDDEGQALETLDRVVERASTLLGAVERTADREIGGVTVRTVSSEVGELVYAGYDGKLVVASAAGPLEAMLADGERLADDSRYTDAREAADAPDETVGFAYVDVDAIASVFAAGAPPDVRQNLEPLGAVFFHGSRDGDETSFSGFVEID